MFQSRIVKALCAVAGIAISVLWAGEKAGRRAELSLKDAAGARVSLRDLSGKPVVLNFWATWCGPCYQEMPLLVETQKEYAGRGVVFVAVSLDDAKTRGQVPSFLAKYDVGFPVWYGATADSLDKLGLGEAVPSTAFLDADGRVVARVLGQIRKEELQERLLWLTGDRSGQAPQAVVKHLDK